MDNISSSFVVITIVLFVVAIGVIFRRQLKGQSRNGSNDNYSILPHTMAHFGGTGDSGFSHAPQSSSDYTNSNSYSGGDYGGGSSGDYGSGSGGDYGGSDFGGGGSGGDFGGGSGGDSGGGGGGVSSSE